MYGYASERDTEQVNNNTYVKMYWEQKHSADS